MGFFNNGNKWGEHADTKEDDKKKEAWWKTYTKMGFSGVGIWLPFILLSGATLVFLIPMFVASFWAFIAYIHIIVLLFLAYMCAGGMVLCIFMGVVENTKGEKDKPKNDEQEKDKKNDGGEGDNEEAKGEEQEKDKTNDGEKGDNEEAKGDKVNEGGEGDNEEAKGEEQEKDKKNDGEEGDNEEAKGDKVNEGGEGDNEEAKGEEQE